MSFDVLSLSQARFACDVLLAVLINRFVTSVVLQQICSAFFFYCVFLMVESD